MRLVQLDALPSHSITLFDSVHLSQSPLARLNSEARVSLLTLDRGGQIGFHQAAVPQLFVVMNGAGWVSDASRAHTPISQGQAALWEAGEWHGAGTDTALTALVIESESLQLAPI